MDKSAADKLLKQVADYRYSEQDELGKGQYGTVYKGFCTKTNVPVAIKKSQINYSPVPNSKSWFFEKFKLLKQFTTQTSLIAFQL